LSAWLALAGCVGDVGPSQQPTGGGAGTGALAGSSGGGGDGGGGASGGSGDGAGPNGGAGAAGSLMATAGTGGATSSVAGSDGAAGVSAIAGRGGGAGTTGGAGTVGGGGASAGTGGTAAGGRGGSPGSSGTSGGGTGGAASTEIPAGYVPALIGVGYGGIRIVSRDAGKTWGDRAYDKPDGGDDDVLLRAVTYGKGIWVATGWKLLTSTDGIRWNDRGKLADGPIPSCNIVEGLAYKDGHFFAACTPWSSPAAVFRSADGVTWTKYANIGDTGGHLFLSYRGGKFVAYGDSKTSYQSTDALTWTVMSGIEQATYCDGTYKSRSACLESAWFDSVWLRADWQGIISRSTDGKSFARAYLDDQKNTLYQSRALAAGYVAP
jgi:hypothetical protein